MLALTVTPPPPLGLGSCPELPLRHLSSRRPHLESGRACCSLLTSAALPYEANLSAEKTGSSLLRPGSLDATHPSCATSRASSLLSLRSESTSVFHLHPPPVTFTISS